MRRWTWSCVLPIPCRPTPGRPRWIATIPPIAARATTRRRSSGCTTRSSSGSRRGSSGDARRASWSIDIGEHIRDGHLDVGPGTGYFLERSGLPEGSHVTILDPNPNVLRHVSRRLTRLDVTAVEADVLKPLPVAGPYESAALHLVIHCLPGPMSRKAVAVANVAAVLAPTGMLFGASVLGTSGSHTWLARRYLQLLQLAGRLRQSRRHRGRAPRDPRGIVRARGPRGRSARSRSSRLRLRGRAAPTGPNG